MKQIVGGTLTDGGGSLRTNFESDRPAEWYAALYRRDGLAGGHVIKLGPGNDEAARAALGAFPGGLQVGGGIDAANGPGWLDAGASHLIVTSWVFREGRLDGSRLEELGKVIGRERLVLDLSCRRRDGEWWVVTDRWQTFTRLPVNRETLQRLAAHCAGFLIHAADVEGLCQGIDLELVERLSRDCPIPVTYAGGARSMEDLETVTRISDGRVDLTIGSALDLFGGTGVRYEDCVAFNRAQARGVRR